MSLPANPGRARTVEFTVHNLEHQTTSYHYTLSVVSADGLAEQPVDGGSFVLDHDRSLKTSRQIVLPRAEGRVAIKAKLEYEGSALGDHAPSAQVQSIHYWTTAGASDGDKEGYEGA